MIVHVESQPLFSSKQILRPFVSQIGVNTFARDAI
jgi:hypothetical protein